MSTTISIALFCAIFTTAAFAADADAPADVKWQSTLFHYDRPPKMVVQQSTPTDEQVNFFMRPPRMTESADTLQSTGPAAPKMLAGTDIIRLVFKDAEGDVVPALLCTPHGKKGPFPLVVAVHGLTSNKAQVCGQVAPSLLKLGYAVLAADLPCHGERPGNPYSLVNGDDVKKTFPLYRKAAIDNLQLIDLASTLPQIDLKPGVTMAGYSLGSWVSSVVGPCDPRVKAMVLMVGGALDIPLKALQSPELAAIDPRVALAHFAGRPLLLLNGRTDEIVKPDWSKRLYAACPEPKKQVWYDSGHFLPAQAFDDAATWIAEQSATRREGEVRKAG